MLRRRLVLLIPVFALALAACLPGTPVPATTAPATPTTLPPSATPPSIATPLPASPTPPPTDAPTEAPTATPTIPLVPASATPPPGGAPLDGGPEGYQDDRSSPLELIESYVNALNRHEYARAYGYWEAGSDVGPFADFEAGFAGTQVITLTTGAILGEGAAGSLFYNVPVILETATTTGPQVFAGCYVLRLAQPANQAEPPFQPLGIRSGELESVPAGGEAEAAMNAACEGGAVDVTPQAPPTGDISSAYYIDDRSSPAAVLRSLFNAVNRHEYARAYGYWDAGSEAPPFADFEAGYAETGSVSVMLGAITADAGAGNLFYRVPAALTVQTTGGEPQKFVGCYVLHLSQPAIQGAPYQPIGIREADVSEVAADSDLAALLATACPPL
jgi:hypothetical protein